MKAAEMPINTVVIIILVIVVLAAILGFFLGVWGPGTGSINYEGAKNTACLKLVATGCGDPSLIEINNPNLGVANLAELCSTYYGIGSNECGSLCGCSK